MPVINLVNVPKDDLIFALHVVGYTLLLHPADVALQVPEHISMVTMETLARKACDLTGRPF